MSPQDLISIAVATIFMLTTIVFAIRYCNLLRLARDEYVKAKDIVSEIVLTFKRHQSRQDETINQLAFQMEAARSAIERLTNRLQGMENRFRNLVTSVESAPVKYKEVINRIDFMQKEVDSTSETQQNLQKQLTVLEEKMQAIGKEGRETPMVGVEKPFSKLTETERVVLQLLIDEGAKTSSEVEKRVGKTREHTARLMKKLWQEGYIERATHRIPYVYRVTEDLKEMILRE